jgi:hypothetical protein
MPLAEIVVDESSDAPEPEIVIVSGQDDFLKHFGLNPIRLRGKRGSRALHSIDCQNLFCEVDKFARVAHPQFNLKPGARIKQTLKPTGPLPAPMFPPKWGI